MREITCDECNTVHTESECPSALDHYVGQCDRCDGDMTAREYSTDCECCAYCYADGIGHGAEAQSRSEGECWIAELFPNLTAEQKLRAMGIFLNYPHNARLPYSSEPCPLPAGASESLPESL